MSERTLDTHTHTHRIRQRNQREPRYSMKYVASDRKKAGTSTDGWRQTLTETGSLLSLKAWKLKLRGCWVAFLMGTRFPEHSRCSGMPSISCGGFRKMLRATRSITTGRESDKSKLLKVALVKKCVTYHSYEAVYCVFEVSMTPTAFRSTFPFL